MDLKANAWVTSNELAKIAGLAPRSMRHILGRTAAGNPSWRGAKLEVRKVKGRGGRAGTRYEVLLGSLPVELQIAYCKTLVSAPGEPPAGQAVVVADRAEQEGQSKALWKAFDSLPAGNKKLAKGRMEIVVADSDLAKSGASAPQRLAAIAKRFDVSTGTVRRLLDLIRGHDRRDWLPLLAPKYRGRQHGLRTTPAAYDEYIKPEYFQLSKPSLRPIHRRAQRLAAERGWQLESYATIARRTAAEPRWFHAMMREGKAALDHICPPQRRDYSTLALHEVWCADGRKADLFCRWDDGTISRPIVVAFLDLRSRVCVGYEVGRRTKTPPSHMPVKKGPFTNR